MLHVPLKYCRLIYLLLLIPVGGSAMSFGINTSITIDNIIGNGFEFHDIELNLNSLLAKESSYHVRIGAVVLPNSRGHIKNVILQCNDGLLTKQEIACRDGELSFKDQLASAEQSKIEFYGNKNGDLSLVLGGFNLAGGSAELKADSREGVWQVDLKSKGVLFSTLREQLPEFPRLFSNGIAQSEITLSGSGTSLQAIRGNALFNNLSFSNDDSTAVGEDVSTKLSFSSRLNQRYWESDFTATTFNGELYFDPIFLDANANPKDVFGKLNWQVGSNKIEFQPLHFEDSNSVHIEIFTAINYQQNKIVSPIQANIQYALFPNVYDDYMLPFLLDTNIADLTTSGTMAGSMLIEEDRIVETDLKLGYLTFKDNQNRFSISKLNGNLGWGKRYAGGNYQFSFDAATLYKLTLGSSQFTFSNNDKALELKPAVSIPILDGALNIEKFLVSSPGQEDQSIVMDISLTPVSMSKLSLTFGWPELNGNLSGYAPNVTYRKGHMDVQGALLVRGFGGTTTIHNLSASDLFSITPKVSADVQLSNLDLSSLTETFSFGEITGKLSGAVNNIQFVNWSPVQFDAWFGTPENDKSRHRISQTAVDNLTQVGNGAPNILSKSFLKFFDSFGYDKLGLGCELKNNTCKMSGVRPRVRESSQGFYIVKGSSVPRIDIVGFTDEVSWPVLIARLKRVVSTKEVIVN